MKLRKRLGPGFGTSSPCSTEATHVRSMKPEALHLLGSQLLSSLSKPEHPHFWCTFLRVFENKLISGSPKVFSKKGRIPSTDHPHLGGFWGSGRSMSGEIQPGFIMVYTM